MGTKNLENKIFGYRPIDDSILYREGALALNPEIRGANILNKTVSEAWEDLKNENSRHKRDKSLDKELTVEFGNAKELSDKIGLITPLKIGSVVGALTLADYLGRSFGGVGGNNVFLPAVGAFTAAAYAINQCGDYVSDKLEDLLKKTHMSSGQVGALSSISTSLPELFSSLKSSFGDEGTKVMALPNFVGSNIFNQAVFAYVAARFFELKEFSKEQKKDIGVMLGVTGLVAGAAYTGSEITPLEGAGITTLGALCVTNLLKKTKTKEEIENSEHLDKNHWKEYIPVYAGLLGAVGLGIAGLKYSADHAVESLYETSLSLGISAGVASLIALAISTSIPEFAVSHSMAKKAVKDNGEEDGEKKSNLKNLIYDTIVKSNIFNMFFAGVTAVATGIAHGEGVPYPKDQMGDLAAVLAAEGALAGLVLGNDKISKNSGYLMIGAYASYFAYRAAEAGL